MPEYNLTIQARIPAALCLVHNFIWTHDLNEGDLPVEAPPLIFQDEHPNATVMHDNRQVIDPGDEGTRELKEWRDNIAEAMWRAYQQLLKERAMEYEDADFFDEIDEIDETEIDNTL